MYSTREKAEEKIEELIELRAKFGQPPIERKIIERWGKFEIVVIEQCRRCGKEVESCGATELILCPACWEKKSKQDAKEATRAGERARQRMAAYDDFEDVCQ